MRWPKYSEVKALFKESKPVMRRPVAKAEVSGSNYRHVASYDFDGEKNLGDSGPIVDYKIKFNELRIRSWQAMLESDTAQTGINRLLTWVIGKGLKPQFEPIESVLNAEGITIRRDTLSKNLEDAFNLFRKSRHADYAGMLTLDELCWEAEKNAIIGGDVLVILRIVDDCVKIQIIDGQHVQSPEYGTEDWPKELANGNRIIDGVELDRRGQHVAYFVRVSAVQGGRPVDNFKFERIEARGKKSKMQMAYLYYGSKHRLNNVRGIPLISSVIEKCQQLQQYTNAALKQAKLAAEVSYKIEHDKDAEGVAPMLNNLARGYDLDGSRNLPQTDDGTELAKNIEVTTGNSSWNLPPGAKMDMLHNENPLYYKDFFETNADAVFAVLSIPPNVAMSKYNDSFSASRAAIMDWLHTLLVKREHHKNGFLQPIVDLWLEWEILNNRIQAPGYLSARASDNYRVIQAYRNVRFIGAQVPHIDPVKEVEAARRKLGKAGEHLPLADLETVIEMLGGGDAEEIMRQYGEELKSAEQKGIKMPAPAPVKKPGLPKD